MKQFTFTSQLAPIIWKYLESRQNEGYTSVHCGYYMQELDCLSKELSDAPVVTKELIDASMIIFASCYSHAIFLSPAMALVCMIFGIHSQFIHWKNNFLMGMIPW